MLKRKKKSKNKTKKDIFKEYEAYEAIRRQKASFKNSNIKPGRDELVIVLLMAVLLAMFIAVLFG